MNPNFRSSEHFPMISFPTIVKIGGKIIYRGKDASDWLTKQTDRNIKATAKLYWS